MDPIKVKCNDCGAEFEVSYSGYNANKRVNNGTPLFRCKSCMKKHRAEMMTKFNESMSPEEKERISKIRSESNHRRWINMPKEERAKQLKLMNSKAEEWRKNVTTEEKERISKIHSQSNINRWNAMNDEQKEQWAQATTDRWNNQSEEYKQQWSKDSIDRWKNKSAEERQEWQTNISTSKKNWWDNVDDETKNDLSEKISNTLQANWEALSDEKKKQWAEERKRDWDNLSDERKAEIANQISESNKKRWKDMPIDKKERTIRNIMIGGHGRNKFHQKFERTFKESHLSNEYSIKPEVVLTNNTVTHSWDYGVYDKYGNLLMVVDLDGAYFHADGEYDYDGIHSKEEYDEKRGLSIPGNIMPCIIQEKRFKDTFEKMLKELMFDYDEYVENTFRWMRSIPFPYPSYTNEELLRSYDQLQRMDCTDKLHENVSVNTRVGDHIIQHFHHSIWHDHRKGDLDPYTAWQDDEMMIEIIKNRIIYQTYLNPNKILQGFNITKKATKVSVFSAGRAKTIVQHFLSKYDTVFDPFSGYSGRMLGTIASGKRYIGQDISEHHVKESNDIIEFLHHYGVKFDAQVTCKDIFQSHGEYPCLFTCSPYSDKEQWDGVPVDTRSCDDWIDVCLERFKCKCYIFVVDHTKKYTKYIASRISNKSHFSDAKEYIIKIETT